MISGHMEYRESSPVFEYKTPTLVTTKAMSAKTTTNSEHLSTRTGKNSRHCSPIGHGITEKESCYRLDQSTLRCYRELLGTPSRCPEFLSGFHELFRPEKSRQLTGNKAATLAYRSGFES